MNAFDQMNLIHNVDIKYGHFRSVSGIEQAGYNAAVSLYRAMTMSVPNGDREYAEAALPASALATIASGNKISFASKRIRRRVLPPTRWKYTALMTGNMRPN